MVFIVLYGTIRLVAAGLLIGVLLLCLSSPVGIVIIFCGTITGCFAVR